jgi:hypothetical protein
MMGGRAFILLKVGRGGPETAEQAEVRVAILLKILGNRPSRGPEITGQG